MKAVRQSAMGDNETLPNIPKGYRQLESVAYTKAGDLYFSQYKKRWVKIGPVSLGNSAGNCGVTIRPEGK